MTERTLSYQKEPTSPDEAMVLGYDEGLLLRKNGAQPNALEFNIELYQGNYPRSPYYDYWLKGFRAGFLGERRPTT